MDSPTLLIVAAVLLALVFDFTNGFHDASNLIASAIASRAMTPVQSVALVGSFTFLGPLLAGTAVANTIGSFVNLDTITPIFSLSVILCGLFAAVGWNLLTWWRGIPSSSSHALVGGLIGAVLVSVGQGHVLWGLTDLITGRLSGVSKVVLALLISPLLGFWVGFIIHRITLVLLRGAQPSINRQLRGLQWLTTAGLAFAHGANDAQKTMGILTLCLLLGGAIGEFKVPLWVIVLSSGAITLGTLAGGWRTLSARLPSPFIDSVHCTH
jgi:PiT family inorganic phosphate transporter